MYFFYEVRRAKESGELRIVGKFSMFQLNLKTTEEKYRRVTQMTFSRFIFTPLNEVDEKISLRMFFSEGTNTK